MATYKSPGVYVEEIPKLPQSVADVPTAIPGFVGYTEFASSNAKLNISDLSGKPKKITSLLDYEKYFGKGCGDRKFVLYDSIRLFYDNGGGVCYIVSMGNYDVVPSEDHFKAGLKKLEEIDEVTMLVVPDAATCFEASTTLANIQNAALLQCGTLQDRFAILDVKEDASKDIDEVLLDFRNRLTSEYRGYGAAYYPYLSTSYTYNDFSFSSVVKKIVADRYSDETGAIVANDLLNATMKDNEKSGIIECFDSNEASCITFLRALDDKKIFNDYLSANSTNVSLRIIFPEIHITLNKTAEIRAALKDFALTEKELDAAIAALDKASIIKKPAFKEAFEILAPGMEFEKVSSEKKIEKCQRYFEKLALEELINAKIDAEGSTYLCDHLYRLDPIVADKEATENGLKDFIPYYAEYEKQMAEDMSIVPPSGAIAGIYAQNDNISGVWKAPANMGIASVKGVTRLINNQIQDDMNVTSTGKSVNAIRAFSGKGIMVWGARTLMGNDNEWRYIPVRRLFNYVEESVQESTEWAVFAPNTQNTWTKIKCQIENFLTNIWRAGGLAGATPADAFYVNVGLGTTMDSQDILEGRLIVEIGMAAVRPAEFIVLKFSHKLQES